MFAPVSLPSCLDAQLQAHFERTRRHFDRLGAKAPVALVLGGGYGRGEGGIARNLDDQPCFFNDLDYFIFTPTPQDPDILDALHVWEREESAFMGVDVEGKCLPESDLKQTPGSMMFYDLVAAQTIVFGPANFFEPYKALARPETIEAIEATRLLWNRGSGLLFARNDLENGGDFAVVHRNQAKAKLALGDALLTIRGKYRAYVRERQEELRRLEEVDSRIAELHAEGVAFKLNPTSTPERGVLVATQKELTAFWLESFFEVETARLKKSFACPEEYSHYSRKIFPTSSSMRNVLLGLRDRFKRGGGVRPLVDYPRGALQRALVLLLEMEPDFDSVSKFLGTQVSTLEEAVKIYSKWWHYYS
jgi:hypothetical protein